MKSIRIGNDIRIEWPIVLSGDVSKLQDLDLTVEVRPSAKIIDTHNYADEIRNNDNKRLLFEKHETTVMMNGGLECRRDIGDGKEHCRPRPPRPCPPRPIPPAPVKLPYHIEDNTLIAMWTADRQFSTGDYDIILYAHKNEGGQAVCDQYRFVRLVSHTAQADAPDDSGIEAVIAMQPVTLELSGLSAYEVAVINGFQGTEEEWLASLKKPAEDAAEELKQEIEQFKEDTKEELQADIKALGYYEDNPEFIRAYTDAEGKFLWGIRIDGSIEWAKGVPTPVQNALKELEAKIKELGEGKIDEIEAALDTKIAELQDAIDVINASLKPLTDTFFYQNNPEFVNVVTDADGKVLFGIKEDGKPYFPKNEMYHVIQNEEYLTAWVDASNKLLFGIKVDGSIYIAKSEYIDAVKEIQGKLTEIEAITENFEVTDNPEFVNVVTDADGKVLFGIKEDGKPYFPKNEMYHVIQNEEYLTAWVDASNKLLFGIKVDGSIYIAKSEYIDAVKEIQGKLTEIEAITENFEVTDNPEFMSVTADSEGKVLEGTLPNGKKYFPKQELLDKYDDVEGRTEITLDAEDKILSYRDKNGVKHEEKLALHEVFDKDNKKLKLATKEDVENVTIDPSEINIAELEGVSNHNTPNLLIASEMQKTFNDGTNSFTPPNVGYEMSNPIECQAGDWFTRTGTATGMVVVTDENDKNGTRLFNADGTTLPNTFQIPKNMPWVRYIRIAAERTGAENGSVVICKGKVAYTADERGDYITVDKLKCHRNNMADDVLYIQSPNGKYWEISVSDEGVISAIEVDPEVISPSDLPFDLPTMKYSGSFNGLFDRFTIMTQKYMYDMKETGIVRIHNFGKTNFMYANFEHVYNSKGQGRYVIAIKGTTAADTFGYFGVVIFDEEFNVITDYSPNGCLTIGNVGTFGAVSDVHDFKYIDDNDILIFTGESNTVSDCPGKGDSFTITHNIIQEIKDGNVYTFRTRDYPYLYTDYANETPSDPHMNTLELDYDGNILANFRNCESWVKIRRFVKENGSVVIGSETNDYDEAIIGRVGGRRNGYYLDSKRVLPDGIFRFFDTPTGYEVSTDEIEEWQFNHCHDLKYWGMKQISGKQYPTYTLFDNNYPISTNIHYKSEDEFSRIVQMSIDWDNLKIKDYKVYIIKGYYSQVRGGATMYDEGKISIAWANMGTWGLYDFTNTGSDTVVSDKTYTGAKILFEAKYDNYKGDSQGLYRANTYKISE